MTNRLDYQTSAGSLDPRITFAQLIEFCRLAVEDCKDLAVWAQLHNDPAKDALWKEIVTNFEKIVPVLAKIGHGKTKSSIGFRQ